MKDKIIKLTEAQYKELERAMQWPEDLAKYEKLNTPTPLTELSKFGLKI